MTRLSIGRRAALALFAAASLSGCAVFKKELPLTPEMAYVRGMQAYQAHRYARAAELLKQWVDANAAGDPRMPQALLALATAHLHTQEYLTSSTEFLRLISDYSTTADQQTARFGLCKAYRSLSPKAQLDQQYTETAITYCASFAEYFAALPQADTARGWVTEMRDKLAEKSYLNGMFYLRRQAVDASVIYFNDVVNLYPETHWAPSALARIGEGYTRIGYRDEAAEARQRLLRDFPQSPEARAAAAAPAPPAAPVAPTPAPAPAPPAP